MSGQTPVSLAELRARGAELGLDVGVSGPDPGPEAGRLERWLAGGDHADMRWLERDPARRSDPRKVVAGARSVVSVGLPHRVELPEAGTDRPRGRIARYALGDDYHDLLLPRVRELAAGLGDPEARPYVDTGPVMEKPRAERAGLGWIGKHTNAVSRRHGSWWLLGAVVTRVELEPGVPHADHCGSCVRCLAACPTGAISPAEPGRLDARRCISWLTIELRGAIPRALRAPMGRWIFGCDLCLEICPWNRFAQPVEEEGFRPRPALLHPVLEELLAWDQATFSRLLKGSPVKRAKRRGLLRNVAVALGNAGDRATIPALARCLKDEAEPLVRGHAAWALGRLGGSGARAALGGARGDPDAFVRDEVAQALDEAP